MRRMTRWQRCARNAACEGSIHSRGPWTHRRHSRLHRATNSGLVPAGKHKGKKWVEVSDDYLGWAVTAPYCPAALKEGCQSEINRRLEERTGGIDEGDKIPFEVEAGVRG